MMDKNFIVGTLSDLKRFLKCKHFEHNIYGLSNKYLEIPDEEHIKIMYEKDQKNLNDIINHLKEVL